MKYDVGGGVYFVLHRSRDPKARRRVFLLAECLDKVLLRPQLLNRHWQLS